MNKYLPGERVYLFIDDAGTLKFKSAIINEVWFDSGDYNSSLVFEDGTTLTVNQNELTSNIALAQAVFNSNNDVSGIPALPLLKVGQSVFVVQNKNICLNTDNGASMQNGRIVACANSTTNNLYLINFDNSNNQIWVGEDQFGTTDSGVKGANFFINYNEAQAWYQELTSKLLTWRIYWFIPGTEQNGTAEVSGNTVSNISLSTVIEEASTVNFALQPINAAATIENVDFIANWTDENISVPVTVDAGGNQTIGSATLASTGGIESTASIKFTTVYNTLTLNFLYTKA